MAGSTTQDVVALLRQVPVFATLGAGDVERTSRQSSQTVPSRVAGVLKGLVQQAIHEGAAASDVLVTATQADVAKLAGSSRESASRFLAVLERAGVITQGRGKLTVHDPSALERYVY